MIECRAGGELEVGEGAVDVVDRRAQACCDEGLRPFHCRRPCCAQAAAGVGKRDQPGAPVDGIALTAHEPTPGEPIQVVGQGGGRLPGPAGELARRHGFGTSDLVDERELLGRHTPCGKLAFEQAPGEERRDAEALEDRLVGHVPIIGGAVVCERCVRFATSSPMSSPTGRAGNQLAVFTDARDLDELTMQELALEVGFSESVFVLPPREGGTVRIRIFTPRKRDPVRRAPVPRHCVRPRCAAAAGRDRAGDGNGIVPVELERDESGRIVSAG